MTPAVWRFAASTALILALGGSRAWAEAAPQSPDTVLLPAAATLGAVAATPGTSITASAKGTTATGMAGQGEDETYQPNRPVEDFEVHFLVALPFTSLFSYVTILTLDSLVEGTYPPEFREMNTVALVSLAAGAAFAIAIGSQGRVPDQSKPLLQDRPPEPAHGPAARDPRPVEVEVVRVTY